MVICFKLLDFMLFIVAMMGGFVLGGITGYGISVTILFKKSEKALMAMQKFLNKR